MPKYIPPGSPTLLDANVIRKLPPGLKTKTKTSPEIARRIQAERDRLVAAGGLPSHYHVVKSDQELGRIAREISSHRIFTFDTETSGLNPWKDELYCCSIGVGGRYYLVNFSHDLLPRLSRSAFRDVVGPYFSREDIRYTGFNTNFDRHFLEEQCGIKTGRAYFDSATAIWLIHDDAPDKKLKHIAQQYLGISGKTYEELFGKTAWVAVDPLVAQYYAIKDGELHQLVFEYCEKQLAKTPACDKLYRELDATVQEIFFNTERTGVDVDEEYINNELLPGLERAEKELLQQLREAGMHEGVDPNSPEQVSRFLFLELNLPNFAQGSTKKEVLVKLADRHPVIPIFMDYRSTMKLKNSFADTLGGTVIDGKIHPSIRTIGSSTGRVSMSNPNLLNQPAKVGPLIRRMFIAPPGYILVSKDLSGQELRITAALSGDKVLIDTVLHGDLYAQSAHLFFGTPLDQLVKGNPQRDIGKTVVLAQLFGAMEWTIAKHFKCSTQKAKKYLDDWARKFWGLTLYNNRTIAKARRQGFVETQLGRRRHFDFKRPGITPYQIAELEREATNLPSQGNAADQIKLNLMLSDYYFKDNGMKSRVLFSIHDEIMYLISLDEWTPEVNAALDDIMCNSLQFGNPPIPMETSTEIYKAWGVPLAKWGMKDGPPEAAWKVAV